MGFFSEYTQVNKLLQQRLQVVVYAESRHYYQYFEKIIDDLLAQEGISICYITSDKNDPLLQKAPAGMNVVYVKWMLGFLFSKIRAEVMLLTMPDLDNYLFKRSAGVGAYIYMFHAAVSTHQQYRKQAFFNYDTIFCTGEYQVQELRKAEALYELPPKEMVQYGYPLIDKIKQQETHKDNSRPSVLIAPSWFSGCIFETCLEEMLQVLSSLPYDIVLRSHPEYEKREKKRFKQIQKLVGQYASITIDHLPNIIDRLSVTDILITDRSGIALEFAFGREKPVLFIETALKQTNADWPELNIEPIENNLRSVVGSTVAPGSMDELPEKIKQLLSANTSFAQQMKEFGATLFYNSPGAYNKGVEYILRKLNKD